MILDIILIGPIGAGKSTQGKLLSEKLQLPRCAMDDLRWAYYKEIGYDEELAKQIAEKEDWLMCNQSAYPVTSGPPVARFTAEELSGSVVTAAERCTLVTHEPEDFLGLYRYWKAFEIHAVERLLADHRDCVIDFGSGHSVFEDDAFFSRAERALAPYENVVLLLPSPHLDESVRLLTERSPCVSGGLDFHEHFVKHHSNHDLAKIVVYTQGKSPEETRDEILVRVKRP